jgi:hypothetical protein
VKKLNREELFLCSKIADRAREMGLYDESPVTLFMDIQNAAEYWDMRLEDWLNADDFNFAHDIVGIAENIIREYPVKFTEHFVPRFAGV